MKKSVFDLLQPSVSDVRRISEKWSLTKQAEAALIDRLPLIAEKMVDRFLSDASIIPNQRNIEATTENANTFLAVIEEYGSSADYIRTIEGVGWEPLVKDVVKRFKHLGPNSALHFLHSVGEDVPRPPERRRG